MWQEATWKTENGIFLNLYGKKASKQQLFQIYKSIGTSPVFVQCPGVQILPIESLHDVQVNTAWALVVYLAMSLHIFVENLMKSSSEFEVWSLKILGIGLNLHTVAACIGC